MHRALCITLQNRLIVTPTPLPVVIQPEHYSSWRCGKKDYTSKILLRRTNGPFLYEIFHYESIGSQKSNQNSQNSRNGVMSKNLVQML